MTGEGARDRSGTTLTDDAALVEGIARRVPAALESAYVQHATRVHALARGLCGEAFAEDLTETVFLDLWKSPAGFDPALGSLRSHLLIQVHSKAVEILRARADQGLVDAEPVLLEGDDVETTISDLPDGERHALVLSYFGGHTYSEVARLLGTTEATAKARIRSGLTRLQSRRSVAIHLR